MRQSQAISVAALVVAVSLLLAVLSWYPSQSAPTTAASTADSLGAMSKADSNANANNPPAAHHHHHVNQPHFMPGGKGAEQPITAETKQMVLDNRAAIESAAGVDQFDVFEPVAQRTQVAGLNYFVKIRIGSDAYAHATLWRKTDQSVHVTKVDTGKTETDPL